MQTEQVFQDSIKNLDKLDDFDRQIKLKHAQLKSAISSKLDSYYEASKKSSAEARQIILSMQNVNQNDTDFSNFTTTIDYDIDWLPESVVESSLSNIKPLYQLKFTSNNSTS